MIESGHKSLLEKSVEAAPKLVLSEAPALPVPSPALSEVEGTVERSPVEGSKGAVEGPPETGRGSPARYVPDRYEGVQYPHSRRS